MWCYGLSKLWNVLMTVNLLQGSGHLSNVLLSVIFKQLQLSIHTIDHLLFLAKQSLECLLGKLVLPCASAVVLLIHLDVF